jgi:hydrogenase expression/formation protein HypE
MPRLSPGKLSSQELARLVFPHLGSTRPEVLVGAALGEDAAVLDLGDSLLVLSTDPITAARQEIGWLAVHIASNDLAAAGAELVGLLLTWLIPPHVAAEELAMMMSDADRAASSLGAAILGGHSEITPYLPQPVVVATAVGKAPRGRLIRTGGAQAEDALYLSKALALEGTAILARELADELRPVLGEELLAQAATFLEEISVVPEGLLAASLGAHAMHDLTEGGLLAGVWEMMEASAYGLQVEEETLPIRMETALLCRALELDPLALVSSGAMLIAAPPGLLEETFAQRGVPLTRIGSFHPEHTLLFVKDGVEQKRVLDGREELWRALARRQDSSRQHDSPRRQDSPRQRDPRTMGEIPPGKERR